MLVDVLVEEEEAVVLMTDRNSLLGTRGRKRCRSSRKRRGGGQEGRVNLPRNQLKKELSLRRQFSGSFLHSEGMRVLTLEEKDWDDQ